MVILPAGHQPEERGPSRWGDMARAAIVAVLALAAVVVLLLLVYVVRYILLVVFAGIALGLAIAPVVDWLAKYRVPRLVSILAIYAGIVGALALAAARLFLPLGEEIIVLWARLPAILEGVRVALQQLEEVAQSNGINIDFEAWARESMGNGGFIGSQLLALPGTGLKLAFGLITAVIVSVHWVLVQHRVSRTLLGIVPASHRLRVAEVFREMGYRVGGYVRGVFILGLIVGLMTFPFLLLLQVHSPLILAIIAGIGEMIPFFGPWLAAVPAVLVALTDSPIKAAEVAVLYFMVQQVENAFLVPFIQGKVVNIPPLAVLLGLITGGVLLGPLGAILSTPFIAAVWVPLDRLAMPALRRWAARR